MKEDVKYVVIDIGEFKNVPRDKDPFEIAKKYDLPVRFMKDGRLPMSTDARKMVADLERLYEEQGGRLY